MPRVPGYQPNQIGFVQPVDERLRTVDDRGGVAGAFGAGMQQFGQDLGQFAVAQDAIAAAQDENYARHLAVQFKSSVDPIVSEYSTLQGKNAVDRGAATQEEIGRIKEAHLSQAANQRQRNLLSTMIEGEAGDYSGRVGSHAAKQQFVMFENTAKSEMALAADQAARDYGDPQLSAKALGEGVAAIERLGNLNGWDDQTRAYERRKFMSGVHSSVIDQNLASDDVDMANAYFEAHSDEMVESERLEALGRLQKPLLERQDHTDLLGVVSGIPAANTEGGATASPWAGVAVNVAREFGLDPVTVGAIMSYETGGTFSPTIMGGKNGNYMGLIQFGPSERQKYGITRSSTPDDWSKAIISFLHDRRFKRGMGVLDLYSTINAGTPGRYNASDGNGTVRSHVGKIVRDHQAGARKWLGGSLGAMPGEWDKTQVYAAIEAEADRRGWQPEKVARMKSLADREISSSEQLLSRQQKQADDAAAEIVLGRREGFTNTASIPRSVWNNLSPQARTRYEETAERNRQPKEPQANGPDIMTLNQMRFLEPDRFKAINLAQFQGKMTRAEMDTILTAQAHARSAKSGEWSPRTGIVSAVSYGQAMGGLKLDDEDTATVMQIMEAEANRLYAVKKAPLSDADYQTLFRSATREVRTTTWLGRESSIPRYELGASNMTDTQRQRIVDAYKAENGGKEPTEDQILRLFRVR